jgi:hypothetical protein
MQNAEGGDASFQFDDRNYNYRSIVSNLISMIEHVQAGIKLIESAIVQESPPGDQDVATNDVAANIVVLDDVTPRYLRAGAALNTCNAGLGVALHVLLDAKTSHHQADERAGYDRRAGQLVGRA